MADIIFFNSNPGGGMSTGVQTLDNGLNKTGTNGELGGPLVKATTIDATGFVFEILGQNFVFIVHADGTLDISHLVANLGSTFTLAAFAQIGYTDSVNHTNIIFNSTGGIVNDTIHDRGLVNAADFEPNFVARSLVTKQYVDGVIPAPGVQSLDNGLTQTGTNGQLGGTLTKDTTIDGTGFTFTITNGTDANVALHVSKTNTGSTALQVEGEAQFDNDVHIDQILSIEGAGGSGAVNFSSGNYIQFIDSQNLRLLSLEFLVSGTFAFDFHNLGFNEHVYLYGKRILNSDNQEFITTAGGLTITGQTKLTFAPVDPTDLVRLTDLGTISSGVVFSVAVQAQTTSGTLGTYAIPGTGNTMFNINYFAIVRSLTAGAVQITIAYTDSTGASRTFNPASLIGLGPGNYNPLTISCTNGTNIVISYVVTAIINFDIGVAIQKLF